MSCSADGGCADLRRARDPRRALSRSTDVGRADLLWLLNDLGPDGVQAVRELAGFDPAPESSEPEPVQPAAKISESGPAVAEPGPRSRQASAVPVSGLTFYQVTERDEVPRPLSPGERPDWFVNAKPIPPADGSKQAHGAPEPARLTPWRRTWPFLRTALGHTREERAPDLNRLVELTARGRVLRRLPRCRRLRWSPNARIILDFSHRLSPFAADLRGLIRPLLHLRGGLGLEILAFTDGVLGPWVRYLDERHLHSVSPPETPAPGTPVLVIGDLGCYGSRSDRAPWLEMGHRLRRAGIRPLALMPCPPRYWDRRFEGLYRPVIWDRARPLPKRPSARVPWPSEPGSLTDDPGAGRLLDLLAPALRVEPALLRALRCRLPGTDMDVGAEVAAWLHPDLERKHLACEWRDAETVARRDTEHAKQPLAERRIAADLLRDGHRYLQPSVREVEAANLARLLGDANADDYLARTVRTFFNPDNPRQGRIQGYVLELAERLPPGAWVSEPMAALWVRANLEQLRGATVTLPDGLDLATVDWVLAGGAEPRVRTLVQQGENLFLIGNPPLDNRLEPGLSADNPVPGSPLADLLLTEAPIQTADLTMPERWESFPASVDQPIPLPASGIRLRGHDAQLTIKPLTRPDWAESIGRDGSGLYVDLVQGQGSRRLRWVPPGPMLSVEADHAIRGIAVPTGCFWDENDYRRWLAGETARADWAQRTGMDDQGLWAEFIVAGVTQRMRWIWPGEYTMGSPEDEPGRSTEERQHQVILTRGCWLADTVCTQALWEAVMGKNPSEFQGEERPVEQVSWEAVRGFIERLNLAVPGLEMRLPSEAEWEYACRAGTETPFWFGDSITTDQANYDGNHPYEDGRKGVDRRETVEVKVLPANAWGLYQMHGNVWEWCDDWYGKYADDTEVDPGGLATGEQRVMRGGGWLGRAGDCRAARRDAGRPGGRGGDLGFRLARGPTSKAAEPQQVKKSQKQNGRHRRWIKPS